MYASGLLFTDQWIWWLLITAGLGGIQQLAMPSARTGVTDAPPVVASASSDADRPRPVAERRRARRINRVCRVTAYCDRGKTAAGIRSGVGQCAAPADIPFGTKVYIPALDRTFVVTDRTAKRFRHNTVDIFIPTRKQCRQFGRHYLECIFTIPAEPPPYGSPTLARAVKRLGRAPRTEPRP